MSDFFLSSQPETDTSHLSSNNPFRTRAVSPSVPARSPTASPFFDPPTTSTSPRPVSRNPFLDPGMASAAPARQHNERLITFDDEPTTTASQSAIDDIFSSLTMDDNTNSRPANVSPKKVVEARSALPPYGSSSGRPDGPGRVAPPPPRGKNVPLRQSPPSVHHPSHSQEEALRSRKVPGFAEGVGGGDSSVRRPSHNSRPRRNSESSVIDVQDKAGLKSGGSSRDSRRREHDSRRPARRHNDIIDQMDASSIFGTVFHHDGPFDALNPHRNRKGSRRAPMQAFPKDSLNNVIGGSGPLNSRPDHRTFMGQGEDEAFRDFSGGVGRAAPSSGPSNKFGSSGGVGVFDPLQRGSILHGDQTLGLGTSTFLEGTPAARATIQRREAERAQDVQDNPLQRKKSLAQRFRSINRGPREPRAYSTEGAPISSRTASGRQGSYDANDEYDSRKGDDVITVRRKGSVAQPSPSSPPGTFGLERRSTTEGTSSRPSTAQRTGQEGASMVVPTTTRTVSGSTDDSQQRSGSGILARVKSLKGGRRPAPPPPIVKDL